LGFLKFGTGWPKRATEQLDQSFLKGRSLLADLDGGQFRMKPNRGFVVNHQFAEADPLRAHLYLSL
jgi:hypothetical protein